MDAETGINMADSNRRALLTDDERAILRGEKEVNEKYYYVVVSRVRQKINRLDEDIAALDHHDSLGDELREVICTED